MWNFFGKLICGEPIIDFDASDNCRLYDRTMEALTSKDEGPSISFDKLKDNCVLLFASTSIQKTTDKSFHPELVGEPVRLQLNFNFPPTDFYVLIVLVERLPSVAVAEIGVVEKIVSEANFWLPAINQSFASIEVSVSLFIMFKLSSHYSARDVCKYEHATQQFWGWTLIRRSKTSSQVVNCRNSGTWKIQFPQAALQADDATANTFLLHCLLF